MYHNIGKYERLLRIVFGVFLIVFAFKGALSGFAVWVLIFAGLMLAITGFVGWCGLYSMLGFSSKGEGLDRITKRDIEKAVREHNVVEEEKVDSKNNVVKNVSKKKKTTSVKKKPVTKKKVSSKKSSTKKSTVKKTTSVKKKPVTSKKK